MLSTVLNFFKQATADGDNELVLDGTVSTSAGGNIKTKTVTLPIGDVSSVGSVWISPGIAGTITKISNVIDAAITTADAGLTFEIGGAAITGSAITIEFTGSAAGDVDQSAPSALNIITATDAIEVVKDGLSDTASNGVVTFEIELA